MISPTPYARDATRHLVHPVDRSLVGSKRRSVELPQATPKSDSGIFR